MDTLSSLLLRGAPGAAAVSAPEAAPLPYQGLRDLAARTVERLNGLGIGRGDRVAVVLNNGPEMAAAFVSIAAGAAIAPLNPGYRTDEFDFYLGDLLPKALVLEAGVDSPSRAVAARLGVPVLELHGERAAGAGSFRLEPLLSAALANTLQRGDAALTGPVARGDAGTVAGHVAMLRKVAPDIRPTYLALARATAQRALLSGRLRASDADPLLELLAHEEDQP